MHQTKELISHFSEQVIAVHGDHTSFKKIMAYQSASADALIFIQQIEQFSTEKSPAVIVTTQATASQLSALFSGCIICVSDTKLAQALFKKHYDPYLARDDEWPDIHPSAIIHESTSLGKNIKIGPNVVIGADCKISGEVIIRANAVIEHNVIIGRSSIISSLANIGYGCELGDRVNIQSGCIIGNEGYGFATDENSNHHQIPHTGTVILHDDVHVGSNTCIDRGTYGSTVINKGVKIDNLCHIAHNVEIGEHSLIAAQCVIAGSSVLGKRVMLSGQTGILDHITIPDDSVLVHRAGVIESLPHGGMWAGIPAKPFREFMRGLRASTRINRLQNEMKELKKLITKNN